MLFFTIALIGAFSFFIKPQPAYSQTLFPQQAQSAPVNVQATIGRYYLSITGYQSPYASIVMTTLSGLFLRSTTADSNGYFTITDVLINDTFPGFCLTAVDFKRLGESETCVRFDEIVSDNKRYADLFLPPTIGLSKELINAGENALIQGYTMPGALVYLSIDGKIIEIQADETGYYSYSFEDVPAGVYVFSATSQLDGKTSLEPENTVTLEALSIPGQISQQGSDIIEKIEDKVPFSLLLFLLVALLLLAIILFLLYRLRAPIIVFFFDFFLKRKRMHHDWFLNKW